jgi:PTS system fructose-specific IIC component|uniref:PTS sugar transporter subunit IIA n=1 Tax=candidate division WOR-3 bacterium TaxID=2052148 RepID=A0A7V3RHW5_UNCW3
MELKISNFLKPDAVILEMNATEKLAAIRELVDFMVGKNIARDREQLFEALAKRENLESTGIGNGIAIPHARTDAVDDLVLVFARSSTGIDFSSIDGKPSHIIFLIASPENKKSEYIIALAKLSRLLRRSPVREQLMKATNSQEILDIIKNNEE